MAKAAINGFGRIGRAAFKILMDTPGLDVAAINDLGSIENMAYLLKYDTVYGRYQKEVVPEEASIKVDGKGIKVFNEKDPSRLPWGQLGIDVVFECTGKFTRKEEIEKHIQAGAKRAILSASPKDQGIPTIVYGVNSPEQGARIISCASCTTNCVTPMMEIMGRRIGIKKAIMTTVHAYTATQSIVDGTSPKGFRRGRAGAQNLVPTSTGAAKAAAKALPQYNGLFDAVAVRAPLPAGSIADVVFLAGRKTSRDEVNWIFKDESDGERYREVVFCSEDEVVSSDIIKDTHAVVMDLDMTRVVDGDLVKLMGWYDNEWGYSSQMVREALELIRQEAPVGA